MTEAISIRTLIKGTIILLSGEVGLPRYARNDKDLLSSGYPPHQGAVAVSKIYEKQSTLNTVINVRSSRKILSKISHTPA